MGCTQSKIENEEAVTRCKERKEFMKKVVSARNNFASTHSGYTMALKNTGAALSDYAHGEIHDLDAASQSQSAHPPPVDPLPPPPPPLPNFTPAPLLRAVSMPEFVIPKSENKPADTIQEEDDDDMEGEETPRHDLSHRKHSHNRSAGAGGRIVEEVEIAPPPPLSPPRPPPSNPVPPPPPPEPKDSTWDYFFPVVQDMPGPSLSQHDTDSQHGESRVNRQEFDDRDSRGYNDGFKRSENVNERSYNDHRLKRSENVDLSNITSNSKVEIVTEDKVIEPEVVKPVKKVKQVVQPPQPVPVEAKRGGSVASNVSLLQILNDLDDKFLKAYQSAYDVSKFLEANRLHYHSNFADNRGHIDHSAKLMRVITWNRSIKGLQSTNDANDDDVDAQESLASVLDKLLAWEKKLYDEVKAGEVMKLEYQRKVALLNKRKKHGTHSEGLERAKAAVSHLHTRYIVDMQSMDSTVSEISQLRDDHLYPKLVDLVDGMATMWEMMNAQHRAQMKIVEDLRSLDVSNTLMETSEDHHTRTVQLWGVADDWHKQFQKLMTHQKDYILNLNSWLKLNLVPIESNLKEKVSSPPRVHRPPIQDLLHSWHERLGRLPDELARSAIGSFAAVMKTIVIHQEDEVKLKMKCEETRKELARKTRSFEDWYQKNMDRLVTRDGMDPEIEDVNQKDPLGERQIVIESVKLRLREEEEAYQKQCRQVREKSLTSLKNHLPELFRAMSEFSDAAAGMYKKLVPLTKFQEQSESLS
ncbi:DUF632 domain-containing protein/DUF630 domain-containing protein [Thalictrum thalictroides]|uniref:DUF632 domain-containing protein/DUF630 domain-containing protein n=1 Tax=Thalictrum thalictroides TaxID=46969 RepID=A0A7J6X3X5_THATH|nr:DUF632 domain-containing protein/DUF630 domain-containing protein [Thalictrum thalictroides]